MPNLSEHFKLFLLLLLLAPVIGFGQFSDDFSDGDFTNNPAWQGDVLNFEVDVNSVLHLIAPAVEDTSVLVTASAAIDTATWEFRARMDFNPSGSNKARVYLVSNSSDLRSSLNGYYVQLGNTPDEVSLYRQSGTSSTKIIDGVDDLLDVDSVHLDVRVTRTTDGVWELFADTSLLGSFASQGTVTDTTHTVSAWFGVLCDYTSTRSDRFYFDNILVTGNAYFDTQAPSVLAATVLSATELEVEFNETVSQATSENANNYTVDNGIGGPLSATRNTTDSTKVNLIFASAFTNGQSYNLSINGVADAAGNAISNATIGFNYVAATPVAFRGIVINEIMADPSPVVALPEVEYIEIYNRSGALLNLAGFTISDGSSTATLPETGVFLGSDAYLILCATSDSAALQPFGATLGVPSFPGLNNSGDDLELRDSSGLLIDEVKYRTSWYQDDSKSSGGFSLEQINPHTPCPGADNWAASTNTNGGSPGQVNAIFSTAPDTNAPVVNGFEITSISTLRIDFSEALDSASTPTNWTINDITIAGFDITADEAQLTVNFATNLDSALFYTLTLNDGPSDCAGNTTTHTIAFGIGALPQPFDLLITEFNPEPSDASSLPNAEFVEIFNASEKLLRIEGVFIADLSGGTELDFDFLSPGEYAIVCDDGDAPLFETFGKVIPVGTMPSLNNTEDVISLERDFRTLDQVAYTDDWYRDNRLTNDLRTLERIDVLELCGRDENWRGSVDEGSPGTENSVADPGALNAEPAITGASATSLSGLLIQCNKTLGNALPVATVTNKSVNLVAFGTSPSALEVDLIEDLIRGQVYTIRLNGLEDCSGRAFTTNSIDFYFHDEGDILVNEVLFNPRSSGTDFVELINVSPHPINLQNWSLGYINSDDSLVYNVISEEAAVLSSGAYICLNEDSLNLRIEYPLSPNETWLLNMNLPSYANDEGAVRLYDGLGASMEFYEYNEDQHFPLIKDRDGVSLERIDTERFTNDPGNWHSASANVGYATPGYENSQTYESETSADRVRLGSDIVSPDNDGYQDILSIDYTLTEPGWSCSITIFDPKGYAQRKLVSNEILGFEGAFSWDGTNDQGEKARTGIHVVFVELFNLKGEREVYRLPCVVASRL